jgi:RDD family protein
MSTVAEPVATAVADPTKVMGRRVVATLVDGLVIAIPWSLYATSELHYTSKAELAEHGMTMKGLCDDWTATHTNDVCIGVDPVFHNAYYGHVDQGPSALLIGLSLLILVFLQGVAGWTFGKLVTGIRCVKDDGTPPGILKAFLRWILLLVDNLPYVLPLVGFLVALTSVGHRRVGDMVAKTFVVRRSAADRPVVVPGLNAAPVEATVPAWTTAAPTYEPAPQPVAKHGPQWDEARGTYIQWDPAQTAWMQWDEATRAWSQIPGQGEDDIPPPPSATPAT